MKKRASIHLIGFIAIGGLSGCDRTTAKNESAYNLGEKQISSCALETNGHSLDYSSYEISVPHDRQHSNEIDCRLARQIGVGTGKPVKVIIKNIAPKSFEKLRECNRASTFPPDKDGKWLPLSEQLRDMPFESQLAISASALDIPQCRSRVFPQIEDGKNDVEKSTVEAGLKLINSTGGYDLSDIGSPAAVLPIATLTRSGRIDTILCASFVYDQATQDLPPSKKLKYQACVQNFTNITEFGER